MSTLGLSRCRATAVWALALVAAAVPAGARSTGPVVVNDSSELIAALANPDSGRHIRLLAGEYPMDHPLEVPDGVTLEGEGRMLFDAAGLPRGFEPGTETTIRVSAGFAGDLLTLGNGVALRGLRLQDLKDDPTQARRRTGNVIVIGSRRPSDAVSATVDRCEIINPNSSDFTKIGPVGHAVLVLTRNLRWATGEAPHAGAEVSARIERSIVQAEGGVVFAINFAARGKTAVSLELNRLGSFLIASGGTSRPDEVHDASTRIVSHRNLYLRESGNRTRFGWALFGGSGSTHFVVPQAVRANRIDASSVEDTFDGFRIGILAAAGRRTYRNSGLVSGNQLELELRGARIRSVGDGAADLVLQAAQSGAWPGDTDSEFPAGGDNVLRVRIDGVQGSGVRANVYTAVNGPTRAEDTRASENRLEILGSRQQFRRQNPGIDPPPPEDLFVVQGH